METKTIYVAFDGVEFRDPVITMQHEKEVVRDWLNRRPDLVKIAEALSPENGGWSDSYAPGYCADEECSDREAFCKLLLKAAISLKGKLP